MKAKGKVRLLSIRKAERPRNGILIYATVQSVTRPHKINHTVTFHETRGWECSCEGGSFGNFCHHTEPVRKAALRLKMLVRKP
jgi:hypothetical protein